MEVEMASLIVGLAGFPVAIFFGISCGRAVYKGEFPAVLTASLIGLGTASGLLHLALDASNWLRP